MNLTALLFIQSKLFAAFTVLLTLVLSCNTGNKNNASDNPGVPKPEKYFSLESPVIDDVFQINDSIPFKINSRKITAEIDSVILFADGIQILTEVKSPLDFISVTQFVKVGRQNIRLRIFFNDSLSQTLTTRITLLSDVTPAALAFKKVRSIPHDPDAFTQGLFYHRGYIYEGTGREGKSKIIKIDPENGSVIRERKLEEDFFGEGITLYKNRIYQLTYRDKVGFVYDMETFERIREFDLQTAEGWGLTTDEQYLIVSDGSSVLYFYHPEYFNLVYQLDVCTDRSLVTSLNELEFINGSIWANVYGKQYLVRIDAVSGKVTGTLDLSSLYPRDIPKDYNHVLNGIAFDPVKESFYITGKLWPVIYEIKVLD